MEVALGQVLHISVRRRSATLGQAIELARVKTPILPSEYSGVIVVYSIHGHRTSKAPHPVRSAQLTGVPPS